jgi:N-acetylglucosaminyldiphosphoundecaprenol N-acetyl-beta-D-mannosaminyltransferase
VTIPNGRTAAEIPRRRLFRLDFIDLHELAPLVDELADYECQPAHGPRRPVVVTPNVDHLVKLDAGIDAVAAQLAEHAAYVLPDGQPVVWASRWLRRPLGSRLAGSTLVGELWPRLAAQQSRVVVVASSAEIARRVEADNPQARALVAPQVSLSERSALDQLVDQCAEMCRDHQATHLFVTLGFPKQCNVIDGVLRELEGSGGPLPLCLAVGASFDMHFGLVRRAPEWMQRTGLEWFYRFLQEPRRLFRRYFVDDLRFVGLVRRERAVLADRALATGSGGHPDERKPQNSSNSCT